MPDISKAGDTIIFGLDDGGNSANESMDFSYCGMVGPEIGSVGMDVAGGGQDLAKRFRGVWMFWKRLRVDRWFCRPRIQGGFPGFGGEDTRRPSVGRELRRRRIRLKIGSYEKQCVWWQLLDMVPAGNFGDQGNANESIRDSLRRKCFLAKVLETNQVKDSTNYGLKG